ncbi:MAG: hypothetical protein A3E01_07755 [Gammaproteobacteria bacterium RIFCSPHIGHO2_12_FULL_63_22]|nr:MAG: hypothetical protein A3E01_07755 [Gammaproteobacteria bacterium RIFCSPHIGHO2_12_FULL_63_22]
MTIGEQIDGLLDSLRDYTIAGLLEQECRRRHSRGHTDQDWQARADFWQRAELGAALETHKV